MDSISDKKNCVDAKRKILSPEQALQTKYRNVLWSPFIKALKEFHLVRNGDKIAAAVSGGKDSLVMAKLFQELRRASKTNFEVVFITMDPGFDKCNRLILEKALSDLNIKSIIYQDNVFEVSEKMAPNYPCYLCARMRRGSLYTRAQALGCNKLALGHHFDDVVETIMMSILYMSRYETMLPKLKSENFDIELIRPLYFIEEKHIKRFIRFSKAVPMSCGCRMAAGLLPGKRREIKDLINDLAKKDPDIKKRIYRSSENVNLEKILGWKTSQGKIHYLDNY